MVIPSHERIRFSRQAASGRHGTMYDEAVYALLFWFYDRVDERYSRVAAAIAQFVLALFIMAALVGLALWLTR